MFLYHFYKGNFFFFFLELCPPTKGEGGHIVFNADPECWRDSFLHAQYLLNQWMELHQTCMDTSLGQVLELIRFW